MASQILGKIKLYATFHNGGGDMILVVFSIYTVDDSFPVDSFFRAKRAAKEAKDAQALPAPVSFCCY